MGDDIVGFSAEVPANYHEHLGSFFFAPYANVMSEHATRLAPRRVLETACGTGILTRALADKLPVAAIVATDLNADMVTVARTTTNGKSNVELRTADMCALPFADHAFDLVACQFGLMFVPDKVQAAREARRVLAPGGRWLVATWAALSTQRSTSIVDEVARAFFPDDPPRFYETPFSMNDSTELERIFREAGFDDVKVERVEARGTAANVRGLATGLLLGTPMSGFLRQRDPSRIPALVDEAERALQKAFGTGPVSDSLEALIAVGSAR